MENQTKDSKQKFIELVRYYEELKDKTQQVRDELQNTMTSLGLNTYLQDPETMLVYKIVKPNGTFTYYKDIDYVRTAKDSERAGTLSKKEAEANNFTLKK